jgi:hypothetical protein
MAGLDRMRNVNGKFKIEQDEYNRKLIVAYTYSGFGATFEFSCQPPPLFYSAKPPLW